MSSLIGLMQVNIFLTACSGKGDSGAVDVTHVVVVAIFFNLYEL